MCTHRDRHVLTHSFPTRRPSGLLAGWPVLLVVDAEGAGQSVAAVAHGLATFPGAPPVAGVIVNRVARDRHAAMIAEGLGVLDLPLCGMIRRDPARAGARSEERRAGKGWGGTCRSRVWPYPIKKK